MVSSLCLSKKIDNQRKRSTRQDGRSQTSFSVRWTPMEAFSSLTRTLSHWRSAICVQSMVTSMNERNHAKNRRWLQSRSDHCFSVLLLSATKAHSLHESESPINLHRSSGGWSVLSLVLSNRGANGDTKELWDTSPSKNENLSVTFTASIALQGLSLHLWNRKELDIHSSALISWNEDDEFHRWISTGFHSYLLPARTRDWSTTSFECQCKKNHLPDRFTSLDALGLVGRQSFQQGLVFARDRNH